MKPVQPEQLTATNAKFGCHLKIDVKMGVCVTWHVHTDAKHSWDIALSLPGK